MAEYIDRGAFLAHMKKTDRYFSVKFDIEEFPAADVVEVKRGRCRYCSPDDCGGLKWDFEDIEVSVTLQRGVLTICNQYGDEAEMPIRFCPNCGARMDGDG